MELLDPRLKRKKDGPFGVPMVYDWSIVESIYPQGKTLSRRMKQMYFDTRGLIVQPPETREWSELSPNSCGLPPQELRVEKSHSTIYELDFNGPQWHNYQQFRKYKLPKPRLEQIPIEHKAGRPNVATTVG
ncbi:hypothetical protein Ciccas_010686 [Cichlidogyrus casuarinus]|uniref:Uncharacterized protein n=1 Tax=Cichlidogyrus casuarinus TaxID=1844966 RepID=A0ABD2PTH3_9PLAT